MSPLSNNFVFPDLFPLLKKKINVRILRQHNVEGTFLICSLLYLMNLDLLLNHIPKFPGRSREPQIFPASEKYVFLGNSRVLETIPYLRAIISTEYSIVIILNCCSSYPLLNVPLPGNIPTVVNFPLHADVRLTNSECFGYKCQQG